MVRKFPPFRSERKMRSTSEGTPQFPNGISGKLPYHLTSNRNFRIFWPNGKHPRGRLNSHFMKIFRNLPYGIVRYQSIVPGDCYFEVSFLCGDFVTKPRNLKENKNKVLMAKKSLPYLPGTNNTQCHWT